MAIADALLPEFDHEMTITRKVIERVPHDRFDWEPHAKSYTAGQLAQHLASIPWWGKMTLSEVELDLALFPPLATPVWRRACMQCQPNNLRDRALLSVSVCRPLGYYKQHKGAGLSVPGRHPTH